MPLHLDDLDVVSHAKGLRSALIVPCNMCPAITVAVREDRPFMRLTKSLLRSAPFVEHIQKLQARLAKHGVRTDVFESTLYHHWFLCMWTEGQREKLREQARSYDAVIVLGCETANVTVRDAVAELGCRVIEGMQVTGYMNANLRVRFPADITFENCKVVPLRQHPEAPESSAHVGEHDPSSVAVLTSPAPGCSGPPAPVTHPATDHAVSRVPRNDQLPTQRVCSKEMSHESRTP